MDEITHHNFQLHLPGLLKVLAEHLYVNKTVAIRELIQNAFDSCVRRTLEAPDPTFQPRIDIAVDPMHRTLTISDNGCGLTAEEIGTYLATIGRSYTRELRDRLTLVSPNDASTLVGQFGFGFLSAFLIASEVTITTRSSRPGNDALRWHATGDEDYTLTAGDRPMAGTTITLQVKPSAAFLLQPHLLRVTVQKYADFLPIPIYSEGSSFRANMMAPPWTAVDSYAASMEYVKRSFETTEPLCLIPLHEEKLDLGHDILTVPLSGFLFVPLISMASVREYGDTRVYIRHMYICDNERDLLPPWARFVRGMIDCPILQPTASREGVHQDEAFEAVQQALERQLTMGLQRVAREEPTTWRTLVQSHASLIMGWAVRDTAFFDQVADLVALRTSRGPLTLPDYLHLTSGTLYYVTTALGSLQEQTLAEGYDVPVIDASWFAVTPFLEKYAAQQPGTALVRLDGDATRLLRPAPEEPFARLLAVYRQRGVRVRVAAFKPTEAPALMLYPRHAPLVQETRQALRAGEAPSGIAGLMSAYINDLDLTDEDIKGTLYLNVSCPLIQQVAAEESESEAMMIILTIIHQVARLFAGRTLVPADVASAYHEMGIALARLFPTEQ